MQDARDKVDYNESHIITAKRAIKVQLIEMFTHVILIVLFYLYSKQQLSI